ncbi:hypothetical protein FC62_GL000087 [Amylolactobacillus amylotrophicus DSM 20534]|uniref:ABC transporter ATP-binding protein n=3 Tax=Amylolactobacillus TaxID=2767876 RepID=A0A1L6XA94_9LACO|nr:MULTISPECIES: ABC transporter transmembrane domain-containing protein [Amylolactobacillus]APT17889.1 ABC transporter ATP-binding protein [Amylolactobacillus amylophilus DSM 20533 = JCM 1125]KRK38404.1 hypothetical protein FC62_GL000087 [Amylolactobacillus amylotrophicus DSM 20534]KRM42953.1 hypothetical protein FD40_GL000752 [Amylolactobacillus amylophilus DSM 20533 = JCM 1125]GED79820.1 ABC transporter ATP-binding protein [Amylolactobacillus amylophilus]
MGIFKKLGWYFKAERKRYTLGIGFLILTAIINLIPPRILGMMADQIDTGSITWERFFTLIGAILSAAILLYLFRYLWRTQIWGGAAKLEWTMRSKLFWHFMQMDETFYQKHRTGDLMAHATNDLSAIQQVAGAGVLTLVDSIVTGGSTIIAMMIFVDWRLTLVAMIPMPFLAVMARVLGTKLHDAFGHSQAAFSKLNNKTQESISGVKVIKTFGQEKEDTAEFDQMVDKTIQINKRVFKLDSMFDPLTTLIIGATYVITIIYGGMLVANKTITIGQLISFISYISAMVWPMFAIGRLFNVLERGSASYDRVMELMNEQSLIKEVNEQPSKLATGDLTYEVERFAYPDEPEHTTLSNINFTLPMGKTLGLVGRVGAGKSTIIKLLMREFDNYTGSIKIGEKNIKDIPLDDLLHAIGYVPQNNFLFSTSIRDNIRFANIDAEQSQVEAAAKKSALHDDILQFPRNYNTLVGENGVSLSGGQKQRLAIARALLKDPEILILDDALSAVDAKTEETILGHLKEDRKDATTIISAHRLTSVMHADEILVINDGRIVEQGTHESLLASRGWYYEMWEKQQLEVKVGGEIDG